MKKRIKLEFYDRSGDKHTVSIEGDVTPEKLQRLVDYAEIVGGTGASTAQHQQTKISRLLDVITTRLSDRSFDSREIWQTYRENWPDDLTLGAVSAYLSRMVDRGILERDGSPAHWAYKLKTSASLSR